MLNRMEIYLSLMHHSIHALQLIQTVPSLSQSMEYLPLSPSHISHTLKLLHQHPFSTSHPTSMHLLISLLPLSPPSLAPSPLQRMSHNVHTSGWKNLPLSVHPLLISLSSLSSSQPLMDLKAKDLLRVVQLPLKHQTILRLFMSALLMLHLHHHPVETMKTLVLMLLIPVPPSKLHWTRISLSHLEQISS